MYKNLYKKLFITAGLALVLTSCSQITPKAPVSEKLTNASSVTYRLPSNVKTDLPFERHSRFVNEGRFSRLGYKGSDLIQVEHRIDNGTAGSGVVYEVSKKVETIDGIAVVTFTPVSKREYQEGLILPFPVPELDIHSYLSNTQIKHKFEIDSEFPAQSIKANFDRLHRKVNARSFSLYDEIKSDLKLQDAYRLDLNNGAVAVLNVQSFPYRNGSKVVFDVVIQTRKHSDLIIDVVSIVKQIEEIALSTVQA